MRNKSIDTLRGLIVLLMILDHTSFFIMNTHFYEGYDFIYSNHTWISFLTRGLSHLCAPGFFLLMGYGMFYSYQKKQSIQVFVYRGLMLIFLQFLIRYIWDFEFIYIGVIFTLGLSMLISGLIIKILIKYGHILAVCLILLSSALAFKGPLFLPGMYAYAYVLYTLIPWIGITWLGIYLAKRPINHMTLGIILFSLFILVRMMGSFGNTHAYNGGLISFFNVTKYPPSLAFILLTLGIDFMLLDFFKRIHPNILIEIGQMPLLMYVVHLSLLRLFSTYIQVDNYFFLYLAWLITSIASYGLSKGLNQVKVIQKYF